MMQMIFRLSDIVSIGFIDPILVNKLIDLSYQLDLWMRTNGI